MIQVRIEIPKKKNLLHGRFLRGKKKTATMADAFERFWKHWEKFWFFTEAIVFIRNQVCAQLALARTYASSSIHAFPAPLASQGLGASK